MFAIPAIANQQIGSGTGLIPGELSFGNAYTGSPLALTNVYPSNWLAHTGAWHTQPGLTGEAFFAYIIAVPEASADFVSNSASTGAELRVMPTRPQLILDADYAGFSVREDLLFEAVLPSAVAPANIVLAPYVFCGSVNSIQLPLPIALPVASADFVDTNVSAEPIVLSGYEPSEATADTISFASPGVLIVAISTAPAPSTADFVSQSSAQI